MSSIKSNIFYNSSLTILNYIVPLITFPYITRMLGVDKIGMCDFVDSIINYFCLLSVMGISTIGVREIARCKGDKRELSRVFSSLVTIVLISTITIAVVLVICIFTIEEFYANRQLLYVGALKLVFNSLLVEWFFAGTENFKYITIRSTIIRIIYVLLVFLFVNESEDYYIYYCLTVGTIVLNAVVNFVYSCSYVRFSIRGISCKEYIKPFLIFGIYGVFTSLYTTFNVIYLGLVSSDSEVGFYSTATKLDRIILALFTAFTGVMMPRMASLASSGNREDFNALYVKSIQMLFSYSFPLICFCSIFADQIVNVIAGPGYEQSVVCLRIALPLIFIIGFEQVQIFQILIPLKKDNAVLLNSMIGGLVGLLLNFIIVPHYQSAGSSIVWLVSEISVLLLSQHVVYKSCKFSFPYRMLGKYVAISLPVLMLLFLLHKYQVFAGFTMYFSLLLLLPYYIFVEIRYMRNQIIIDVLGKICSKIKM